MGIAEFILKSEVEGLHPSYSSQDARRAHLNLEL